jgi:hypothetical protein
MKYKVRYINNIDPEDCVLEFNTEEEAEAFIEEGLNIYKEYGKNFDYDYADFGNKTEFWISGGDEYASWERMWI